jgi:uncharacterized protein
MSLRQRSLTPREVVEQVRRMVAGEGIVFADLFAEDGVLRYPFAAPGQPEELVGREAIRSYHGAASTRRNMIDMAGLDVQVYETDDPEVVVAQIEHHGTSRATGEPYRVRAVGIIRVREGQIVSYDDYLNPLRLAQVFGRTDDLVAALTDA